MGNFFNRNNDQLLEVPEQIVEENNNEQVDNIIATGLKTIIKVKNPFYLLKETIHLEKDSTKNIYYIKFNYDSLVNFNCYINFDVKKNSQRNNLQQKDDYELCYIPTDKFVEKNIIMNNLPKGKNQQFYNENAFLDFEYFELNTTRRKLPLEEYEEEEEEEDDDLDNNNINNDNNQVGEDKINKNKQNEENETLIDINNKEKNDNNEQNNNINNEENEEYEEIFDIGIEFVPCYEKDSEEYEKNKENNEIILISLFNIEKKDNNDLEIKCVLQKLKKHNYFFELKDIYDGSGNNGKCVICYTIIRDTIFLPCRHSCCCQSCSGTLRPKICPLCKENIQDIICLNKDLDDDDGSSKDLDKEDDILNDVESNNQSDNDKEPVQSINDS